MGTLLEMRGVTKRFGGLTALTGVDFQLEEGTIGSIIGPNGAGKTTLFNVLTGVYRPEAGEVLFRERSLVGLRPDQITALGICRTFQNIRLFANMTVVENVLVGMHARIPLSLVDVLARTHRFHREEGQLWGQAATLLEVVGLRPRRTRWPRACRTGSSGVWSWRARWRRRRPCSSWTSQRPA